MVGQIAGRVNLQNCYVGFPSSAGGIRLRYIPISMIGIFKNFSVCVRFFKKKLDFFNGRNKIANVS